MLKTTVIFMGLKCDECILGDGGSVPNKVKVYSWTKYAYYIWQLSHPNRLSDD